MYVYLMTMIIIILLMLFIYSDSIMEPTPGARVCYCDRMVEVDKNGRQVVLEVIRDILDGW